MRHRRAVSLAVVLAVPLFAACATGGVTTGSEIEAQMDLPEYDGPKATVTVGPCTDKSSGAMNFAIERDGERQQFSYNSQVGQGMADMFVTGLLNTDRFRVLETDALGALQQEQEIAGEEAGKAMKAADLLVTCAVTSLEPNAGGVGLGVMDVLGGIFGVGGLKKSSVTLDIRLVDVETREVLTAFSADGTATDAALGGIFGGGTIGGLGAFSNTPIEGAVKKAILQASEHLATETPKEYFGNSKETRR